MVKKEIVAEVKRAWAYYQYAYNLYQLYNEQESLAGTLRSSGELRYQQGDIDLSERNMITTMASDLHTRWLQAKDESFELLFHAGQGKEGSVAHRAQ